MTDQNYRLERFTNPARTTVLDAAGQWLATLTDRAYTARLRGPERTFAEPDFAPTVTHETWVRTLPAPFNGTLNEPWIIDALEANAAGVPDVFAIAMQYLKGAPAKMDGGLQIAGNAKYGPLEKGERQEGADFHDYLGVNWTYADGTVDPAKPKEFRSLDCSGFIRMIWGYRHSLETKTYTDTIPLCLGCKDGSALPRRAVQMEKSAPGIVLISNAKIQVTHFKSLRPGDLVFFDADTNDDDKIDHLGMFLGLDSAGEHRFISSRKSKNGPTIADTFLQNGKVTKSVLEGTGKYPAHFRSARRL